MLQKKTQRPIEIGLKARMTRRYVNINGVAIGGGVAVAIWWWWCRSGVAVGAITIVVCFVWLRFIGQPLIELIVTKHADVIKIADVINMLTYRDGNTCGILVPSKIGPRMEADHHRQRRRFEVAVDAGGVYKGCEERHHQQRGCRNVVCFMFFLLLYLGFFLGGLLLYPYKTMSRGDEA